MRQRAESPYLIPWEPRTLGVMDTRICLIAALVASALALPATAAALYKTIDANGTVMFSDVPPADARIVEQRIAGPGMPLYEYPENDAALARANELHDLAEHALALARQDAGSERAGLRLAAGRMTPGDKDRVAFYKKDVRTARLQLMDLLRERQSPVQPRL
jgi:hypothetical protein